MSRPASGSVLGVDVGYSPKRRSSAVCRLSWQDGSLAWSISRFRHIEPEWREALAASVADTRLLCAAFDGPLRCGFDEIGRYRRAEQMLTRELGRKIGKPGQSSTPVGRRLNGAANLYARSIAGRAEIAPARHEHAIDNASIAEAFPSTFLGVMLPWPTGVAVTRGTRSDIFFQRHAETGGLQALIDSFLPGCRTMAAWDTVTNHDDRAALVCALTALCVAAGDYVAVGDQDGWIVLPPRQFIQAWAWKDLVENAAGGACLATVSPCQPQAARRRVSP